MTNAGYIKAIIVIKHNICNVRSVVIGASVIDSSNVRNFRTARNAPFGAFFPRRVLSHSSTLHDRYLCRMPVLDNLHIVVHSSINEWESFR